MMVGVPLVAAAAGLAAICFPGWGIKQMLARSGFRWRDDETSALLASFALGIHLNAIVFLFCWVFVDPADRVQTVVAIVCLNLAFGLAGCVLRSSMAAPRTGLVVLLVVGIASGTFAAVNYPSVLDSIQVLQSQHWALGWDGGYATLPSAFVRLHHFLIGGLAVPTQPGFAGLTLLPSLIQPDLPVVTTASGSKVILLALAAAVSDQIAGRFGIRWRLLAALVVFGSLVLSQFGLLGLIEQGKDSVYAVLMLLASVVATLDTVADDHEPGLFLSAAILLGAVAVPFGLVFWMIFLVASGGSRLRLLFRVGAWCLCPLAVVVTGVRSFSSGGKESFGLLPTLLVGLVVLAVARAVIPRVDAQRWTPSRRWGVALAFLPAALVASVAAMLPMRVGIVTGQSGTEATIQYSVPLDGSTSAIEYFFGAYPCNNAPLAAIALLVCIVLPLTSAKHRTPCRLALFTFLPATTALALVHHRLHLHIITDYNVWDIAKDTVQWYVGAFAALIVWMGIEAVTKSLPRRASLSVGAAISGLCLFGVVSTHHLFVESLARPKTVTDSGGYDDERVARAMNHLWREDRGDRLFVGRNSPLSNDFYAYQMYGARQTSFFDDKTTFPSDGRAVFLVGAADARRVVLLAREQQAGVRVAGLGHDAFAIDVRFDGSDSSVAHDVPPWTVTMLAGGHAAEKVHGRTLRWIGRGARLAVVGRGDESATVCLAIGIVNPWADRGAELTISSGATTQITVVPFDATVVHPADLRACVDVRDGYAIVDLEANRPAGRFPGSANSRNVSFGIVWPIVAE